MMTAPDVLGVLSLLDGAGLTAWVDGGWGVDALLGETTRDHGDLDLAVLLPQLEAVRSVLWRPRRHRAADWLPTSLALADQAGREICTRPTGDGGGTRRCRTVGASTTRRRARHHRRLRPLHGRRHPGPAHLGYQPAAKDRVDMGRLRERLGVALPVPYSSSRV